MSLQQGLIEGVVSAITFAAPSRWYEVVKGGTRMTLFVGGYGVVVNDRRWESLSEEHRKVLEEAMRLTEKWNYDHTVENIARSPRS